MRKLDPVPAINPIGGVNGKQWTVGITRTWHDWLITLSRLINAASKSSGGAAIADGEAAVAQTEVEGQPLTDGLYRISWYLRLTQVASVSSSVQLTLYWDDGSTVTYQIPAIASNLLTDIQSGSIVVAAVGGSTIDYSVAYTSVGGTPMQYRLSINVEELPR